MRKSDRNILYYEQCIKWVSLVFLCLFQYFAVVSQNNFHGSSQLSFNYNSLNANPQQLPPYYFVWSGLQQFGYADLPFEFNWNISTASPYGRMIPNAFSIKFNAEQFRKGLRQRAEQHIKAESLGRLKNRTLLNEIRNEQNAIANFFNDPGVKDQLRLIEEMDSIKNLIEGKPQLHPTTADSIILRLAVLEARAPNQNAFRELKSKMEELDSLQSNLDVEDTLNANRLYDYKKLDDKNNLKKELASRGKLSKLENAGLLIDCFNAGRFSPYWNDQTLKGVTTDGAEISIAPGKYYLGLVAGSIFPWQMLSRPETDQPFSRNMIGLKIGIGQENATNFRIHLLQFKDQLASSAVLYPPSPKANYLAGFSYGILALNGRLQAKGNLTGSQTLNSMIEYNDPLLHTGQITIPNPDNPARWIENILYQKQNSLKFSTDKSFQNNIRFALWQKGPVLTSELKYIGTYYQSFGSPFLPADYQMIKAGAEQPIWKNKIFALTNYSNYSDNLSGLKRFTSYWNHYDAGIRLTPIQSLHILINYKTIHQTSPANYFYHFMILQANHIYQKNFWRSIASLTYSVQAPTGTQRISNFMGNYEIVSPAGHKFRSAFTGIFAGSNPAYSFFITPQISISRKIITGIGVNYYFSPGYFFQNGLLCDAAVKFSEKISFSLRGEYKWMKSYSIEKNYQNGDQWYLTSRLIAYW